MIITKTPFRISFAGGGSDLKEFYSQSPGAVISATINKFMYISTHKFFDVDKIRIKYSQTETVTDIEDIKHPIVKEALRKFKISGAIEISSNADIPSKTGLGSSSAFAVGLLNNLYAVMGKLVTKKQLAEEASDIEINKLQDPIGKQDHYAVAFGGLNVIKFNPSGSVEIEPIHIKEKIYKTLQDNLLMFYVGERVFTPSILTEMRENIKTQKNVEILKNMVKLVWELRDAVYAGDLVHFGKILHENWLLKQQLASNITNPYINELYEKALKSGATGGKLLGAGGSGFLLFYCEQDQQEKLRAAMAGLREMKFKLEDEGTKVIYVGEDVHDEY